MTQTCRIVAATAFLVSSLAAAVEIPSVDDQIAAAILAAPEDRRDGAGVLGYGPDGALVTLREGSNDLICLAHNPQVERYSVACYHESLEPFMARGRELTALGVTGRERAEIRLQDIEAGRLEMPRQPRTLYVLSGSGFNSEKGEVESPYLRWVIYVPYATAESTGLSTKAAASAPWLMGAGTAGAHIMINPPRPE